MKKSVRETVREAIEPTVTGMGYDIWDIQYSKVGTDYTLEITIDKAGGITIDDCETVHRAIDPIIDECDPVEGFYYLQVSSPGIERELRTDDHLARSVGERVEAKLFSPVDGRKSVTGRLSSFDADSITIDEEGGSVTLPRQAVSKLSTVYFDDEKK